MKQVLIILSFVSCIASAQEIKVIKTRQLTPKYTGDYAASGVSPDGKQLLVTGTNSKGLYLIDIKNGKTRKLTESAGAGYEPLFSPDGRYICYRSDGYVDRKKYSSLIKIDLLTGDTVILEKKSRNITRPVTAGGNLVYLADGHQQSKDFTGKLLKSTINETYVMVEELSPVLYINGTKKPFRPGGDGSYIWVSLSPDKTKMLYSLVGKGTFVCDLEGKVIASLGKINAPKWLNNQIIVGMDDKDDGQMVTSSELVAYSVASGKKTYLTSTTARKEMYPIPFYDGKQIAYRTSEGSLFIMKVKIK